MRIAQKRPYVAILILLITLLAIAACDPAAQELAEQTEGRNLIARGSS